MAVITTGAHPKALWPGVHAFAMALYKKHPALWSQMFNVVSSEKAYEEEVETTAFDLAQVKSEGAGTAYTGHNQGFTKRYTHVTYSLGYIVTEEEKDDNLYESKSFRRAELLSRSFATSKEMVHANVYNRAFSSSYLGGDAKELCATDHATLAGNQQNELTVAADLSEASLEDVITLIMIAKNSKGHPIALKPRKLITAPQNWANATRILKSTLQNDTNLNAINVMDGRLPEGHMTNPYLTDADAWFVLTDAPHSMTSFTRKEYVFKQDNDFDTSNAKAKGTERYSCGWTDWRGVYGSPGA